MEISPISFTGTANCARRKMMTPTKLKKHAKKMTLAKLFRANQPRQKRIFTPYECMPSFCKQIYS